MSGPIALKPEDRPASEPEGLLQTWEIETLTRALLSTRPEGVPWPELFGFLSWCNEARVSAELRKGLLDGRLVAFEWNQTAGPTVGIPGGRRQR